MSEFKVYVTVSCLTKCCPPISTPKTTHTTHQYTHNYKYIYNISSCIKLFWALCAKNNRFLPFEWAFQPVTRLSGQARPRVGYPINSYIRHILPTWVSRGEGGVQGAHKAVKFGVVSKFVECTARPAEGPKKLAYFPGSSHLFEPKTVLNTPPGRRGRGGRVEKRF